MVKLQDVFGKTCLVRSYFLSSIAPRSDWLRFETSTAVRALSDDVNQLRSDKIIDAVVIATDAPSHFELARQAPFFLVHRTSEMRRC